MIGLQGDRAALRFDWVRVCVTCASQPIPDQSLTTILRQVYVQWPSPLHCCRRLCDIV